MSCKFEVSASEIASLVSLYNFEMTHRLAMTSSLYDGECEKMYGKLVRQAKRCAPLLWAGYGTAKETELKLIRELQLTAPRQLRIMNEELRMRNLQPAFGRQVRNLKPAHNNRSDGDRQTM